MLRRAIALLGTTLRFSTYIVSTQENLERGAQLRQPALSNIMQTKTYFQKRCHNESLAGAVAKQHLS